MKNLSRAALLCTVMFATTSLCAADDQLEAVPLGGKSRNAVIFYSGIGALSGMAAYEGFQLLTHHFNLDALHKHPLRAFFWGAVGAVVGGLWKYQHTAEKHFEFARNELVRISQNELFNLLITTSPDTLIDVLKDRYFREKLPLYTAYKRIHNICSAVDQSLESLTRVLNSYRDDLYAESKDLQIFAEAYLEILKNTFKRLKDDPNFITECNAGTLELMKEAQEAAAHAAESSAFTQQMAYMAGHHHHDNYVSMNISV